MSAIHTPGYFFEVEYVTGGAPGVSRFYYYQTVNTNEHVYSFSWNAAPITPNSNYETIVYKTNQSAWFDYDTSTNPWTLTTTNGVTEGTDFNGNVMMKWGHAAYPDPTVSAGGAGTGTLSVVPTQFTQSVPSGVTSVTHPGDLGRQLYYTIAKARSSGTYNIYLDDVFHISVTHTNGTVSSGQVAGEQYGQNYKLYFGQVFVSSSLNILVTEFTWQPMLKKVFCNFW